MIAKVSPIFKWLHFNKVVKWRFSPNFPSSFRTTIIFSVLGLFELRRPLSHFCKYNNFYSLFFAKGESVPPSFHVLSVESTYFPFSWVPHCFLLPLVMQQREKGIMQQCEMGDVSGLIFLLNWNGNLWSYHFPSTSYKFLGSQCSCQ